MGSSQLPRDYRAHFYVCYVVTDPCTVPIQLHPLFHTGHDYDDRSDGIFKWTTSLHEEIIHRKEPLRVYLPDCEHFTWYLVLTDITKLLAEYHLLYL
jgi:hypothetical protein